MNGPRRFFTWCERTGVDPLTAERTHISLYVRHLTDTCGLRGSTVNSYFTPVKGFYKWACIEGFLDRDPVVHAKLPKVDYRKRSPLEREELRRFRAAAKHLGGRHWAMGELLCVPRPADQRGPRVAHRELPEHRARPPGDGAAP